MVTAANGHADSPRRRLRNHHLQQVFCAAVADPVVAIDAQLLRIRIRSVAAAAHRQTVASARIFLLYLMQIRTRSADG